MDEYVGISLCMGFVPSPGMAGNLHESQNGWSKCRMRVI